jgi:hypothetical protein
MAPQYLTDSILAEIARELGLMVGVLRRLDWIPMNNRKRANYLNLCRQTRNKTSYNRAAK